MKISALWITKNEEANIARSIESVKAVADEIVVVDTGSTDDTVAIAEKCGARIETFEWVNDFSKARNYAMKHVDGDVIFFMDADEWFEPALEAKDKAILPKAFANPKVHVLNVQRTNFDPHTDLLVAVDRVMRIMRGKGAVHYEAVIHEHVRPTRDARLVRIDMPDWNIMHNGYNRELSKGKRERNQELLLQAVETEENELLLALYHAYIVREGFSLFQIALATDHLNWLLTHPGPMRQFLIHYRDVGVTILFEGMKLASVRRDYVSRRQLRKNLMELGKLVYDKEPVSKIADQYYNVYFDFVDARFLQELPKAAQAAEAIRNGQTMDMEDYLHAMVDLYTVASEAAWMRGDRETAFDYASKSMQQAEGYVLSNSLMQLLRCVKGLPAQDVILFLNSMLPIEKAGVREMLLTNLHFEGFEDLYVYYLKKAIDAGTAKRSDFWYLMIVLGKAEEAAAAAHEARENTDPQAVQQLLFLSVICSGDAQLFEQYRGDLKQDYVDVLDLFYYNRPPQEQIEYGVAMSNYALIAFAAGRPVANKLLASFRGLEGEAFSLQGQYYMRSGLYRELLLEKLADPAPVNRVGQMWLAECNAMSGNYLQALEHLKTVLNNVELNDSWFNLLSVVAETADFESVRQEAQDIYDCYHDDYEAWIDYQDVVNTGLMIEADSKKQRKELAAMTQEAFDDAVQVGVKEPFKKQVEVLRQAADLYYEKKSYVAALDCYRRLLACGAADAETWGGLAQLFGQLENEELSRVMWQRAKS